MIVNQPGTGPAAVLSEINPRILQHHVRDWIARNVELMNIGQWSTQNTTL